MQEGWGKCPCGRRALIGCRRGQSGLEGLRRQDDFQAGDGAPAAGEHRAVSQRGAAHAGGSAVHFGVHAAKRLHRGAYRAADLHGKLHH